MRKNRHLYGKAVNLDKMVQPKKAIDTPEGRICSRKKFCDGKPQPLDDKHFQKTHYGYSAGCKICMYGERKEKRAAKKDEFFQFF